jgi:hypothetical protein
MGGVQLAQDLPSHIRTRAGTLIFLYTKRNLRVPAATNCVISLARFVAVAAQGLEALKEHFKNSKFPCDSDEYLPVSFSPPRDGKQLTEPVPIVGRSPAPSSVSGASSPPKTTRDTSVDPLALELIPPASSSGDGASSTTTSSHAPSDHADDDNEEALERLAGEIPRLTLHQLGS